jgi:transposase
MVLTAQRARLKNRIHATLAKYALNLDETTDIFGVGVRDELRVRLKELPAQTAFCAEKLLEQLETLQEQIKLFEQRAKRLFRSTPELELVMSMPGVGEILGMVICLEIGDISRFPGPAHLAAYAGTTPRVHSSGGKTRYGQLRRDVNRYLKWAFVEAASVISRHRRSHPQRHVCRLYERLKSSKGHQKAIGAVARHLAESTYWMLSRKETYRDPVLSRLVNLKG